MSTLIQIKESEKSSPILPQRYFFWPTWSYWRRKGFNAAKLWVVFVFLVIPPAIGSVLGSFTSLGWAAYAIIIPASYFVPSIVLGVFESWIRRKALLQSNIPASLKSASSSISQKK